MAPNKLVYNTNVMHTFANNVKMVGKYRGSKTDSTRPCNAERHSLILSYRNPVDFLHLRISILLVTPVQSIHIQGRGVVGAHVCH